jgi:hypothetical protein
MSYAAKLVCSFEQYRFWQLGGLYCVVKGTEEKPRAELFRYSNLLYLLDAKNIPHHARPRR